MNLEEARDLLRRCQREREEAREQVKTGQATIESTRLIIEGVLHRFPELSEDEHEWGDLSWDIEGKPRGDMAVLSILQVAENEPFSVHEMVEALENRGWLPESANAANAVRTALKRLKSNPESGVEKDRYSNGTVFYRFVERPSTSPTPTGYGYDDDPF